MRTSRAGLVRPNRPDASVSGKTSGSSAAAALTPLSPASFVQLQRTVGNRAVQRALQDRLLQPKRQKTEQDPTLEQYTSCFPHIKEDVPKAFADSEKHYGDSLVTGRNIENLLKGAENKKAKAWDEDYVTRNYRTTAEPEGQKVKMQTLASEDNELKSQPKPKNPEANKEPGKYTNYYHPGKKEFNAYDNWHYDETNINFNKLLVFQYRKAVEKLNELEKGKKESEVGATAESLREQIRELELQIEKLSAPPTEVEPSEKQTTDTQGEQQPSVDPLKQARKEKSKAARKLKQIDSVGKREVKGGLDVLTRDPIVNQPTLDTMFWTDNWFTALKESEVTLTDKDGDDFWALLGTPNGRAGGYMAVESAEELGITGIEKITYKNGSMSIYFSKG